MKKIICDKTICFFDNEDKEIMYLDYSFDECIFGINTSEKIIISKDMELYPLLEEFMKQDYVFGNEELQNKLKKGREDELEEIEMAESVIQAYINEKES